MGSREKGLHRVRGKAPAHLPYSSASCFPPAEDVRPHSKGQCSVWGHHNMRLRALGLGYFWDLLQGNPRPFGILVHAEVKAYCIQIGKPTEVAKERKLSSSSSPPERAANLETGMAAATGDMGPVNFYFLVISLWRCRKLWIFCYSHYVKSLCFVWKLLKFLLISVSHHSLSNN